MRVLIIVCLLIFSGSVYSQLTSSSSDPIYGLDPKLFNGTRYSFYQGASVKGNPYLISPEYLDGTLTIQGIVYQDVRLNYDIYNQELLLSYQDANNSSSILQVSKAWLTAFSIGEKQFSSILGPEGFSLYQVFGEGPSQILVAWRKLLSVEQGNSVFSFSKPLRSFYLRKDGNNQVFMNKRGFLAALPEEIRPGIRKYMQEHHIKFRRITDHQIEELANQLATH